MLFLHVTTQIPNRKNDDLLGAKGRTLFPTFMYLDDKGGVLSAQPGEIDLNAMKGSLHKKAASRRAGYVALAKKAADGDKKAITRLAVLRLEMRSTSLAEFRKAYPDLSKLGEGSRDSVLGMIGSEAVMNAKEIIRAAGRDADKLNAAYGKVGELILKAAKLGAEPMDDGPRRAFWYFLGAAGSRHNRVDMLKLAIEGFKEDAEDNPQLGLQVERWIKKVKELETMPPKAKGADEKKPEEMEGRDEVEEEDMG